MAFDSVVLKGVTRRDCLLLVEDILAGKDKKIKTTIYQVRDGERVKVIERVVDDSPSHPESCYYHLGNPPGGYCTDRNYCKDCDENTWDEECPKCGKELNND